MIKLRKRMRLKRIARALELPRIYPAVYNFVIHDDVAVFNGSRYNGKTTACTLSALVEKRIPTKDTVTALYDDGLLEEIYKLDPDYVENSEVIKGLYCMDMLNAYYRATAAGINVRK